MKYWEIIADNLSKAGWSWGCVSAIDFNGRTIWIADAHRDDGKRFIVRADEKLTAFVELESVIGSARTAIGLTMRVAAFYYLRRYVDTNSRLHACRARSYMKIRLGLTRRTPTMVLSLTC